MGWSVGAGLMSFGPNDSLHGAASFCTFQARSAGDQGPGAGRPWRERAEPAATKRLARAKLAQRDDGPACYPEGVPFNAHGEGSATSWAEFERLRLLLRDGHKGVAKVINALAYQHRKHPRRKAVAGELRYFRNNRKRMHYASLKQRALPIGSGVVELANKTLVTVRMKRAGARWSIDGGQAILTLRALAKSQRFDRAWKLLARTYVAPVDDPSTPDKPHLRQVA